MDEIKYETQNIENFKVVLIGDTGVGKSSIINRFIKKDFKENMISTTGATYSTKILGFPELSKSCKLNVNFLYNIYHYKCLNRFGIQLVKKDIKV